MSEGTYYVLGEEYKVITPEEKSYYDGLSNPRFEATKDIIQKLNSKIDYSALDNWTYNGTYDHANDPDGVVDKIFVVWRGPIGQAKHH